MSEVESKEFAEVGDLLSSAEGEKEIELKTIPKKVRIKKITVGELAAIMKVAKDNDLEQYIWLVFKGLVRPKLKIDEVRKLNHQVLFELALHISKYSGLDRESLSKLENLLVGQSSLKVSS